MENVLFMMAFLLCDKPPSGFMFICVDHTYFFTIFLLYAM